jgi:hypothetical protein
MAAIAGGFDLKTPGDEWGNQHQILCGERMTDPTHGMTESKDHWMNRTRSDDTDVSDSSCQQIRCELTLPKYQEGHDGQAIAKTDDAAIADKGTVDPQVSTQMTLKNVTGRN